MRKHAAFFIFLAAALSLSPAFGQSAPGWSRGYVPTAAEWNAAFASKQDVLGYSPVNKNGDTMLGKLVMQQSNTSNAPLNVPQGGPPAIPQNGDIWTTSAGLFAYINGGTVGPFSSITSPTLSNPVVTGTLTAQGLVDISGASAGQIKFPATQNPSSNANTLDDYSEGTFTPVLTFATPGDLSVSYSNQLGAYTKVGRIVFYTVNIVTSAFTWTTATGALEITGLPYTSANVTQQRFPGAAAVSGITKATYTQFYPQVNENTTQISVGANGSGVTIASVNAADMPTGGSIILRLNGWYIAVN